MQHLLYLNIVHIKGRIGLEECEFIVESWLDRQPLEDKTIKIPTYNYASHQKTINLGHLKIQLDFHPKRAVCGFMAFNGKVKSPMDMKNTTIVKINDLSE